MFVTNIIQTQGEFTETISDAAGCETIYIFDHLTDDIISEHGLEYNLDGKNILEEDGYTYAYAGNKYIYDRQLSFTEIIIDIHSVCMTFNLDIDLFNFGNEEILDQKLSVLLDVISKSYYNHELEYNHFVDKYYSNTDKSYVLLRVRPRDKTYNFYTITTKDVCLFAYEKLFLLIIDKVINTENRLNKRFLTTKSANKN